MWLISPKNEYLILSSKELLDILSSLNNYKLRNNAEVAQAQARLG